MLDRTNSMLLPSRVKFIAIITTQSLSIVDYPQKYRVLLTVFLALIIIRALQNIDDTKIKVF